MLEKGKKKVHSFTEDLVTFSPTFFPLSLSDYMTTLWVCG